jgi:hypothetical protein
VPSLGMPSGERPALSERSPATVLDHRIADQAPGLR